MNLQAILADVDEMLGWVPLWFVGLSLIAVAILLALLLYRVAVWLLNRAFGTRLPLLAVFVERTAGPARLALCLAAVALVLPLAPLDDSIRTPLMRVFVAAFIALIGVIALHVDYRADVPRIRRWLEEAVKQSRLWDGAVVNLQVIDADPRTVELRALVSARNAPQSWDLRCEMREKLIAFIRDEMPEALPRERAILIPQGDDDADFLRRPAAPEKMRASARN